jgi:hypothetical protein
MLCQGGVLLQACRFCRPLHSAWLVQQMTWCCMPLLWALLGMAVDFPLVYTSVTNSTAVSTV